MPAQVQVYPLTTSIWRQYVVCESGATHYELLASHSFNILNFKIPPSPYSSLLPPIPFPSSTRNEWHTGCWLRQQVHNAGWPHISDCVISGKSFFHFSFFMSHWFFSPHVWPCWPLSPLPCRHHDPNHVDYGSTSPLQYTPRYVPTFILSPWGTMLTSCSPTVAGTRPRMALHHPHFMLLWHHHSIWTWSSP